MRAHTQRNSTSEDSQAGEAGKGREGAVRDARDLVVSEIPAKVRE